jgi:pyrroloquinoline quinone biosynthesis protein B
MRLKILGSAAGGGFPQWNCNYRLSRSVRNGEQGFRRRTQSSLGVSPDGREWILFNASPDIREQIGATRELQPREDGPVRASPIGAVVLTNADVDHIAGLLSLRERQRFAIYATARVLRVLSENSIFNVLDRDLVARRELELNVPTPIADWQGKPTSVVVGPFRFQARWPFSWRTPARRKKVSARRKAIPWGFASCRTAAIHLHCTCRAALPSMPI